MSSFTNCSNNLIHVQLYIDLSFVLHQLTINDDEQIFKSKLTPDCLNFGQKRQILLYEGN